MRRLDGLPKTIPDVIYIHDEELIEKYHLDELTGQASIVLSLYQTAKGPTNNREIAERLEKHPEFKTRRKPVYGKTPATQIVLFYFRMFQQFGVVKFADPLEEKKSLARRVDNLEKNQIFTKGRYKHVRVNGRFAPRGNQ